MKKSKNEIGEEKLKILGQIIYPDIKKLTDDILEESGNFYSKSIYIGSYEPFTQNKKEFQLPKDFKKLNLFSERKIIDELIRGKSHLINEKKIRDIDENKK